jgi:hypothetical protein
MRRTPWIALAALASALGIRLLGLLAPLLPPLPACPLKALTGIPCATCGLTRCVLALGQGRWGEAFHWHPAAVAGLALLPLLAVWDLARALRGRPYPSLPPGRGWRLLAAALLLAVWALQVARGI